MVLTLPWNTPLKKIVLTLFLAPWVSAHALDLTSQEELRAVGMATEVARLCKAPAQDWDHLKDFQQLALKSYAHLEKTSDAPVKAEFEHGRKTAQKLRDELSPENCKVLMAQIRQTNDSLVKANELLRSVLPESVLKTLAPAPKDNSADKKPSADKKGTVPAAKKGEKLDLP